MQRVGLSWEPYPASHVLACEWCPSTYVISSNLLDLPTARFFSLLRGWRTFVDGRQWCPDCRAARDPKPPPVLVLPKAKPIRPR